MRIWLALVSFVTALWCLTSIVTDSGPSALIWVWPGDLPTSRLIGVMLLTIAAGSLCSLLARGTARPMPSMILTYDLGLSTASLSITLLGKPAKVSYVLVFGIVFLVSTVFVAERWPSERRNQIVPFSRLIE